jgi:predicted nucleotidyltransferase
MRKSSALDALLTRTTQGILSATLLQPGRWWYLSDLGKHLRRTPSSLQAPLAVLAAAGILRVRRDGNRVYYQANDAGPLYPELAGLVAKTVGLADVLRACLERFAGEISVAFVYGSFARAAERATSDVDLLVVARACLRELTPALQEAETRLGRPVNVRLYAPEDFARKLRRKDHFLSAILAGEKVFIFGSERDLEAATGRRAG